WTASSPAYAQAVVPYLFSNPERLVFIWARNRCTQRINREYNIFYWRKNLNKVKRQIKWRLEHVIMIDDSPEKLERHYGNVITVTPFEGQPDDTELRDLLPYLSWLQTVENVRSVEKRYWRSFQLPAEGEAGEISS
ncbi:HAD family hydrolase, partial [Scytonema tolypothrichoides VB-61278]